MIDKFQVKADQEAYERLVAEIERGTLLLHIDAKGSVTGTLRKADRSTVNVVGQANGRAINLILNLGKGQLIYGTGTLENAIEQCKGSVGGPFVGPAEGDSGGWLSSQMCFGAARDCTEAQAGNHES